MDRSNTGKKDNKIVFLILYSLIQKMYLYGCKSCYTFFNFDWFFNYGKACIQSEMLIIYHAYPQETTPKFCEGFVDTITRCRNRNL